MLFTLSPSRCPYSCSFCLYISLDSWNFVFSDDQELWPPRDPTERRVASPEQEFTLPSSPWTYENGSVNPNLEPFNAHLRNQDSSAKRRRPDPGMSALPPYHPDYQGGGNVADDYSSDSEESDNGKRPFVRRGSEGYEVRPVEREDMLQHYLRELGEQPERYHRYIPYLESESEDDYVPLAQARGRFQ